jgi:hypothetical protein
MAEIRTLGLSGFDREEEAAFRDLFDRCAGSGWRLASEAEADALLIDFDSMYGQMAWLKVQDGQRPIAALTAAGRADTDFLLQRPVSADSLKTLLQAIAAALSPDQAGAASPPAEVLVASDPAQSDPPTEPTPTDLPPADPAAPTPVAAAEPAPPAAGHVLAEWLQPGAFPGPVQLAGAEPALVIDPVGNSYLGSSALKPYAAHCRGEIAADRWQALTAAEFEQVTSSLASQPLNRLRWLAGLCSHDGRLGPELATAERFKLTRWPQSEREFPKHFRIATAMLKQPGSVDEIAAASGASSAEVADFINACHAIDVIEAERPEIATAEAGGKPGLMNRLRGKG